MALLQNGYRDRSSGVRIFGLTASNLSVPSALQANANLTGTKRNLGASDGAWTDEQVGLPHGYRNSHAWLFAQKNGSLKSHNEAQGDASLTVNLAGGKNATATIVGTSDFAATGQLVVSAAATLVGTSSLSGNLLAALIADAELIGTSSMSGAVTAKGWMTATIVGTSTLTATRYATGTLTATISATTELSPESLATAVWTQALEGVYTAEEMMRVMAAALAGEVSGAGTSTITIRDINDATDRIVATVDGTGNRTAITLDVD